MTKPADWPPVDPLTVELCADGEIPLAKLTPRERETVVGMLAAKGHTPGEIERRTHGGRGAVANALARIRDHAATP